MALYFSLSIDDSEVLNVRPQNTMWEYGGLDRDGDIDNPWRGAGKMAPFDQQVILRFTFSVPITAPAICFFVCLFVLCFTSQVNSYGHCGTVSSPNHTFPGQA